MFIIEHQTKGVLVDQDVDYDGRTWKSRWSWSKPRHEAKQFATAEATAQAFLRLPPRVQAQAYIMRATPDGWAAL